MMEERVIRLLFESCREHVPLVGKAVRGICSTATKDEDVLYQIELCIVEVVNNVIAHAYLMQKGREIEVITIVNHEFCHFNIKDTGLKNHTPIPRKDLEIDPEDIENLPESGMGLFIISHLMDELSYYEESGKNITSMRKYLKKVTSLRT